MAGNATPKTGKTVMISMTTLAVMNIVTIVSLRGLPVMAEYGLTSIFYYVFAAIVFLIPVALVAAELASTFPQKGGVFRWVGEAFGSKTGFAAMYYQWQAVVIWFPTILIFAAAAIANIWWPESFDEKLAANKWYTLAVTIALYWLATWMVLGGMQKAIRLSSKAGLYGTIIPVAVLIVLAVVYIATGQPVEMSTKASFFPDLSNIGALVLATGVFLFFSGMEIQAVHIQELRNPARDYPRAVFLSAIVIIVIFVLGTLAVSVVIPTKDINLVQALFAVYDKLWSMVGLGWMGNIMAILITIGVIGQTFALTIGPSTGLLAVGKAGYLPKAMQHTNKNGIQTAILMVQGVFVSILLLMLTVLPSVQSAYEILSQLSTIIFMTMYLVMYVAAIRLRYTQPNRPRPFKIPGGKVGIWIVGVVGFLSALMTALLGFLPPSQIATGSPAVYISITVGCSLLFIAIPFIIQAFRKPSWHAADTDFEPFSWQKKP